MLRQAKGVTELKVGTGYQSETLDFYHRLARSDIYADIGKKKPGQGV
jgi:hypothetical protein